MKKVKLGKTDMNVSVLGLGGISLQRVSQDVAVEIIGQCRANNINFIDTAEVYGLSQTYIGFALKKLGRENFYVATKSKSYTYEGIKNSIERSLKEINVDYIDLYQLHNVKDLETLELVLSDKGALRALQEAKKEGLIKHIGITGHIKEVLLKAIDNNCFETVQFPFNPVEYQGIELFKKAIDKGMGTIAMKPMAGGAITNHSLALRYILNSGFISITVPGVDDVNQVNENILAVNNIQPLSNEELEILNKEVKSLGNDFCRRCGYCLPCIKGIDIPNVFLSVGYVTRYGLIDFGKKKYNNLQVKADACIKCGMCETRCPYNLPIREKLEEAIWICKY